MTINEKIRAAVQNVPAIVDFYYAEPDAVMSNTKVNYPALFRLLRNEDTIAANNVGEKIAQNEYFMLAQPVSRTPEGDKEEAVENDLTAAALKFLIELEKQGVNFTLVPTLRWGRRDLASYAVCLIFRITITDAATIAGGCISQKYLPDATPTDEC